MSEGKKIEIADDIDFSEGFICRPKHLFEALTSEKYVSTYTMSPAKIDAKDGGEFSLFGGSVTGTYVEVTPTKIVQKWRFSNWPDNHYSTVTITLSEPEDAVTKMHVHQTNIPDRDKFMNHSQREKTLDGWRKYFCDHIHKYVGYAKYNFEDDD